MLTKPQITALNRARATLEAIQEKLQDKDAYKFGRLAQAAETAEEAIFSVLVVAKVYAITELAPDDMNPEGRDI